jgi:hypothetical protein
MALSLCRITLQLRGGVTTIGTRANSSPQLRRCSNTACPQPDKPNGRQRYDRSDNDREYVIPVKGTGAKSGLQKLIQQRTDRGSGCAPKRSNSATAHDCGKQEHRNCNSTQTSYAICEAEVIDGVLTNPWSKQIASDFCCGESHCSGHKK